jgi:hypothetical protein
MTGSNVDPPVTNRRIRGPSGRCTRPSRTFRGIETGRVANPHIAGNQRAKNGAGKRAFAARFRHHALVNQIEKLRDAGEQRDIARSQRRHERARADRLEKHHARAGGERQKEIGHLAQGVEERQHAEQSVALADGHNRERRPALGFEIRVREDDALGIGCGPGRIEHDGHRVIRHVGHRRRGIVAGRRERIRDASRVTAQQRQHRELTRHLRRIAARAVSRYRGVVIRTRAPQ